MAFPKNFTIRYSRPEWLNPSGKTFQEILKECLDQFQTIDSTRVTVTNPQRGEIFDRDPKKGGIYLHIVFWTDDQPASLVPKNTSKDSAELSEQAPPSHADYMEGHGMFFVSGDHCLIMSSGLIYLKIEKYLKTLFRKGKKEIPGLPEDVDGFRLVDASNTDVMKQINKDGGVKEVRLRIANLHDSENDDSSSNLFDRSRRFLREQVTSLEEQRALLEASENMRAEIVISCTKRKANLEPRILEDMFGDHRYEPDEEDHGNTFSIETMEGKKVRRNQLVLSKRVVLQVHANRIDHKEAWEKMRDNFLELQEDGHLSK